MSKETRIYLITEEQYNEWLYNHNITNLAYHENYISEISDEEWIEMSEECGLVYSLNHFATRWNDAYDSTPTADNTYMRII